jgi:hypothetical protein
MASGAVSVPPSTPWRIALRPTRSKRARPGRQALRFGDGSDPPAHSGRSRISRPRALSRSAHHDPTENAALPSARPTLPTLVWKEVPNPWTRAPPAPRAYMRRQRVEPDCPERRIRRTFNRDFQKLMPHVEPLQRRLLSHQTEPSVSGGFRVSGQSRQRACGPLTGGAVPLFPAAPTSQDSGATFVRLAPPGRATRPHPGDVRCQRQPGCAPSWIKPAYRECLWRLTV